MSAGEAWVQAIAAGDEEGMLAVLDPAVDFRALTPGAEWEASTSAATAAIVLGRWFAAPRGIDAIERVERATIGDRDRITYLLRATTPDGEAVIEQQAYIESAGGRITWMRLLCSGFRSAHGC